MVCVCLREVMTQKVNNRQTNCDTCNECLWCCVSKRVARVTKSKRNIQYVDGDGLGAA